MHRIIFKINPDYPKIPIWLKIDTIQPIKETNTMKQVAPLRYDVIFKKAFGVPEIFTAFVHDFLNIELEIEVHPPWNPTGFWTDWER